MGIHVDIAEIIFESDSSVGIPEERFTIPLPYYENGKDKEELLDIKKSLLEIYEPYCETSVTIFWHKKGIGKVYFCDGTEID